MMLCFVHNEDFLLSYAVRGLTHHLEIPTNSMYTYAIPFFLHEFELGPFLKESTIRPS